MKDYYLLIAGVFFIVIFLNNNHYLDFMCPKKWNCQNVKVTDKELTGIESE